MFEVHMHGSAEGTKWRGSTYHGGTNERQGSELHMVNKEEGKEKQQLTGLEPATSRSIAYIPFGSSAMAILKVGMD